MDIAQLQHVFDPSQGIFTAMQIEDPRPVAVDAHLARLAARCRTVYGAELPNGLRERLLRAARSSTSRDGERLRVELIPNESGGLDEKIDVGVRPQPPDELTLTPVVVPNWNGEHKWLHRPDVGDAHGGTLYIDYEWCVLEMDNASVYAIVDDTLVTPPLDGRILPGVSRAAVLRAARAVGLTVEERPLPLSEVEPKRVV